MGKGDLLVRKIHTGTVIDHIPAGRALVVLKLLGITGREGLRVALVMNVESKKMGKKDIVKVEDKLLTQEETDKIALVAPNATINIIKDYEVVEKRRVSPPNTLEGLISCPNPTCITRKRGEPVSTRFVMINRKPLTYQCMYCATIISEEDILKQFMHKHG